MKAGVLLYGPPAVGKDTITRELAQIGPFAHFHRLKCGPGRTAGYRMISPTDLDQIPGTDRIYVNQRYGATYVVDRPGLVELWTAGLTPVIHLGQPDAVTATTSGAPEARWFVVDLQCPIPVLAARIKARATGDDAARLQAARSTPRLAHPDLAVDTNSTRPEQAARLIEERLNSSRV